MAIVKVEQTVTLRDGTVEVDVDLEEFSDEDLTAELESRGFLVKYPKDGDLNELLDAFKIGDPNALERCKRYLEDMTGRTI